jgi:hypothetical protein
MHVLRLDGTSGVVQSVLVLEQPARMYNLSVAEAHTFFVGEGEWLVHNCANRIPNPFGRRGSPAHVKRIAEAETRLARRGWTTISGGSLAERRVLIPGTGRYRYADLVMGRNGRQIAIQVGKATRNGPIAREAQALRDLRSTGLFSRIHFIAYD